MGAPHRITIDEPGRPKRNQLNRTTSFDDGHLRILDGLLWGCHPWWGIWGEWYPGYSVVIVDIYDGALIRLHTSHPDLCFKLKGDPGSAMDRQRFDYHTHIRVAPAPIPAMLDAIKAHIAQEAPCP